MSNGLTGRADERVWRILPLLNDFTYEHILGVLVLDCSDDPGSDHGLLPGLCQIEVVDTLLGTLVNVRFHLLGYVHATHVHLAKTKISNCIKAFLPGKMPICGFLVDQDLLRQQSC